MAKGVNSIAFPAISTGIFGYPLDKAAVVAISTVRDFLTKYPDAFSDVYFVVFSPDAEQAYSSALTN